MGGIDFLNQETFGIIEILLEGKHYLRELAETTKLAPSSVHKIMAKLVLKKIVVVEKKKNRKFFGLNYNSPLTRSALSIIFVDKIAGTKAFRKLKKLKPIGIYLFGTAASGRITEESDIDLAVHFEKRPGSLLITQIKRELSNQVKRDVQLVTLTKNRIDSMKKGGIELLNQIKNNSVTLAGEDLE